MSKDFQQIAKEKMDKMQEQMDKMQESMGYINTQNQVMFNSLSQPLMRPTPDSPPFFQFDTASAINTANPSTTLSTSSHSYSHSSHTHHYRHAEVNGVVTEHVDEYKAELNGVDIPYPH